MTQSWSQTSGFARTALVMVAQMTRLNVSAKQGAAINGGVVMNNLVKEVFVAIRANTAATVAEAETASRAAILAVAEWLEQHTDGLTDGELYLVARMRAELERLRGEK